MKQSNYETVRKNFIMSVRFRCLLLMSTLLFSGLGMTVTAQTTALRVSVDVQDAAITKVFQAIEQQTDFSIVYNTSDINPQRIVSVSADNMALPALLDKLFAGMGVSYTFKDKHIVLSKKSEPLATNSKGGVF